MHSDEVVYDLVDVRARVVDERVGVGPVAAHVHAGLDGAHQRVTLVFQVCLRDRRLEISKCLFGGLNSLRWFGEAETEIKTTVNIQQMKFTYIFTGFQLVKQPIIIYFYPHIYND